MKQSNNGQPNDNVSQRLEQPKLTAAAITGRLNKGGVMEMHDNFCDEGGEIPEEEPILGFLVDPASGVILVLIGDEEHPAGPDPLLS